MTRAGLPTIGQTDSVTDLCYIYELVGFQRTASVRLIGDSHLIFHLDLSKQVLNL